MAKIFKDSGASVRGNVLSLDEFKLFRDVDAGFPEDKQKKIIGQAERVLDNPIEALPLSLYREYFKNGNRMNFENKYGTRRYAAFTLALAEYFEGKGRFTEKLADEVWAMMEETTWMLPAHLYLNPSTPYENVPSAYNQDRIHGIELLSAATAATFAMIYHFAGKALDTISPIITERMLYEIRERSTKPFVNCDFWWTGVAGRKTNNWCPWVVSNTLTAVALVEGDIRVRERALERAITYLDNFTNDYKPDGGCDEGPAYWCHAAGSLFDCLEIIEDMTAGKINVYSHPLVKAMGEYEARMNINGDRFVNFADCSAKVSLDGYHVVRYGNKCGSDILVSFGEVMSRTNAVSLQSANAYRSVKTLQTPTITDIPAPRAAKKTYFPDLKVMITRECEDNTKGMLLAMKGGHNNEMHNHNDIGSFVVYYGGEPVIIDAGVGTYTRQTFSPDRYKLWFMQSNYHNLPTFDGIGQLNGAQYCSEDEAYDEESGALRLQITKAFDPAAGVRSYVREGSMKDGVVHIVDDISLDKAREIDFHFLTSKAPVLNSDGTISLAEGRTLTYDAAFTAEIEEFDPTGMNTVNNWGTEVLWRIHVKATAKNLKCEFTVK